MVRRRPRLLSAPPRLDPPCWHRILHWGMDESNPLVLRGMLLLRAGVAVQRQGLRRLPQLPPPAYRRRQRPQHTQQQVSAP
jgi:hypothetical protein